MSKSVSFPPAFHSAGEPHAFLAKYKGSLEKRISLTKARELYQAAHLAVYLMALGRDAEALEVAGFLSAEIPFAGKQNVWSPTGNAITIASFLLRKVGEATAADAQLAKLIKHRSYADRERSHYPTIIEQIRADIAIGGADASKKWGCHRLAMAVSNAIYWRETNAPGFHHHGYYTNEVLDHSIAVGFPELRRRMEGH